MNFILSSLIFRHKNSVVEVRTRSGHVEDLHDAPGWAPMWLTMHFSKTYTQLLLNLPPELRENAIEYRRLKKLIKQVVEELTSIGVFRDSAVVTRPQILAGLSPDILHKVLLDSQTANIKGKAKDIGSAWVEIGSSEDATGLPKVVYEINTDSDHFEPRLRLIVSSAEEEFVSFPTIPSPDNLLDVESQHAHITELENAMVQEDDQLIVTSSNRGRGAGSSGHRSDSTSPEPTRYVNHIFSISQVSN